MRILNYISVVYISRRCCSCRFAFVLAGGISVGVGVGIGVLQPATTQISFIKFVVLIQQRERKREKSLAKPTE